MSKQHRKVPKGYRLIFRRHRKVPGTNRVIDARRYGYRAWPILVPDNK